MQRQTSCDPLILVRQRIVETVHPVIVLDVAGVQSCCRPFSVFIKETCECKGE